MSESSIKYSCVYAADLRGGLRRRAKARAHLDLRLHALKSLCPPFAALLDNKISFTECVLGMINTLRRDGFQLHRVYAYSTVLHDVAQPSRSNTAVSSSVAQAALDWQGDQEDDLDDVEVLHLVKQLAATASFPTCLKIGGRSNSTPTTLVLAKIQSPTRPVVCMHLCPINVQLYCSQLQSNLDNMTLHNMTSFMRHDC
jgi:hypothetical protein